MITQHNTLTLLRVLENDTRKHTARIPGYKISDKRHHHGTFSGGFNKEYSIGDPPFGY